MNHRRLMTRAWREWLFLLAACLFSIVGGLDRSAAQRLDNPDMLVIQSITLSKNTLTNGGSILVTVTAQSNTPVNWLNRSLDGPSGNIYGGGSGWTFNEILPGIWQAYWTETISQWAPSGTYTYRDISVSNEGQLTSAPWPPITFTVSNSNPAQVPVIQSATLSKDTLTNGGSILVTVTAQSNAPVNWLNRSLDGPKGNIYGGGSGWTFNEISPGVWQAYWTETISQWAPSGTYTYRDISVRNEGRLTSAPWPPITFSVSNSNPAQVPVIQSATLSKDTLTNGGSILVTVTAQSNAPVNWLNRSLDGPKGNVYGGGSGWTFNEISPGVWQAYWTETISRWAPSGTYTYRDISVRNQGQLTSAPWPPITFTVLPPKRVYLPILSVAAH